LLIAEFNDARHQSGFTGVLPAQGAFFSNAKAKNRLATGCQLLAFG
jgi:hypothetical protein